MIEYFIEFSHAEADGLLLFQSKFILFFISLATSLLTVSAIGCHIFDVYILPIRTIDVLVAWHLPHFAGYTLPTLISFIVDIVNFGLGMFLGSTFASNFGCILHFFITDFI